MALQRHRSRDSDVSRSLSLVQSAGPGGRLVQGEETQMAGGECRGTKGLSSDLPSPWGCSSPRWPSSHAFPRERRPQARGEPGPGHGELTVRSTCPSAKADCYGGPAQTPFTGPMTPSPRCLNVGCSWLTFPSSPENRFQWAQQPGPGSYVPPRGDSWE